MIIRLLLGLVVPVAILLAPDPKEPETHERKKPRHNSRGRSGRRRSGGTGDSGDARELAATPATAEIGENGNDDVREASGSGPRGPVRGQLDSATQDDLQPVTVDDAAESNAPTGA